MPESRSVLLGILTETDSETGVEYKYFIWEVMKETVARNWEMRW